MEGQAVGAAPSAAPGNDTPGRKLAKPGGSGRMNFAMKAVLEPYLYLSPALILLALVMFVPLVVGISYAFQNLSLTNPFDRGWVGLENFRELWDDRKFWLSLRNTVWWTVASVVLQFGLGLGLALLLNRPYFGRRLVQALVFLPWAVPTFLSGLTWAWLFNPIIGPIPHWLFALGVLSEPLWGGLSFCTSGFRENFRKSRYVPMG